MYIMYIPIDLENPTHNSHQHELLAECTRGGWGQNGSVVLKDVEGQQIKVVVLSKETVKRDIFGGKG